MPRGSGRYSRAGTPTYRSEVVCARNLGPDPEGVVDLSPQGLSKFDRDMQRLIDRGVRLGCTPTRRGEPMVLSHPLLPKPLYVPTDGAFGELRRLTHALDRLEQAIQAREGPLEPRTAEAEESATPTENASEAAQEVPPMPTPAPPPSRKTVHVEADQDTQMVLKLNDFQDSIAIMFQKLVDEANELRQLLAQAETERDDALKRAAEAEATREIQQQSLARALGIAPEMLTKLHEEAGP